MKLFKSIRWRIQIWQSLILSVVVINLGVLFYQHEKQAVFARVDANLQRKLPLLFPRFKGPTRHEVDGFSEYRPAGRNAEKRNRSERENQQVNARLNTEFSNGYFYAVWFHGSKTPEMSSNAPSGLQPFKDAKVKVSEVQEQSGFRYIYSANSRILCAVVGFPMIETEAGLNHLAVNIILSCILIIVISMVVGWWITGLVVKPFQKIKKVAGVVATGQLDARIPNDVKSGELGELAHALNWTFSQLEESFAYQRAFSANASHELRSPIAAMLMETQVALSRERSADEYREALTICERNLSALRTIAENLLHLSRLDAGEASAERSSNDLKTVAESCIGQLKGLFEAHGAELILQLDAAPCCIDKNAFEQVILNLLSNAVVHSQDGVQVTLCSGIKDGSAFLSVNDNGPGIPTAIQERIFQRFYHQTTSRESAHISSGLGLAIVETIVKQHEGTLTVDSATGEGACFTITL